MVPNESERAVPLKPQWPPPRARGMAAFPAAFRGEEHFRSLLGVVEISRDGAVERVYFRKPGQGGTGILLCSLNLPRSSPTLGRTA